MDSEHSRLDHCGIDRLFDLEANELGFRLYAVEENRFRFPSCLITFFAEAHTIESELRD